TGNATNEPRIVKYTDDGQLTCSAGGVNPGAVFSITGTGSIVGEDQSYTFTVEPKCKGIIIEIVWTPSTGSTGGLSFQLNAPDYGGITGGGSYWSGASADSPIKIVVTEKELKNYATDGGDFSLYAYGPDSGTAIMQPWTSYISVFYNAPPANGYTGITP
ncbi:MAG: hypothetical protein PHH26_07180, partial [Candidatus Thermoplasmatota archaeon]|nr:hypothetical protein [Candidatus Thermoplasmatota archaeon]